MSSLQSFSFFFFFNDTATTEIYTLSLHDALPISSCGAASEANRARSMISFVGEGQTAGRSCSGPRQRKKDRKSTRLNSSHVRISYAVFCLKKKKKNILEIQLLISSQTRATLALGS